MLRWWLVFGKWIFGHFIAIFVHPTDLAGRIADHEGIGRHIFGNDRARTNHAIFAEFMATDNRSVSPNGDAATENGLFVFVLAADGCAGVDDVGKHHRRAEEHIVLADNARIDRDVVLDLAVTAEFDVGRDDYVLTYITVLAYLATGHDVAEMPYFCALADLAVLIDIG